MEVATMSKQYVARFSDEQCRQLETPTVLRGGKVEEVAHDTHPLHEYTGEPYGVRR